MDGSILMHGQVLQDFELPMCQMHVAVRSSCAQVPEIDRDVTNPDLIDHARRSPQDRVDARHQFLDVERLRHIVIGPQLETADLVTALAFRGDHDHRASAPLPHQAAQLEAALSRKHDVEQDQVWQERSTRDECVVSVRGVPYDKPIDDEVVGEYFRDSGIVFDNENAL